MSYRNFEEYLEINYKEKIYKDLRFFIIKSKDYAVYRRFKSPIADVKIKNLNVKKVEYTKSERDEVAFNFYTIASFDVYSFENIIDWYNGFVFR